jgi:hypothetical protein
MRFLLILTLFIAMAFLAGCTAPPQAARTKASAPPTPKLALTVKVATVDLSNYGKRIEKKDIERFSASLRREQIEVLAVQGITRYPNVKTRVDFVTELAAQMDMRQVFGESIDISGRQQGNAVFSIYPIRSNQKKEFDVASAFTESALQVSIDAGVRDFILVSTRLPARATGQDLAKCIQTISGLQATPASPFVVTGNLPPVKKGSESEIFADIQSSLPDGSARQLTSRLWYVPGELFHVVGARVVKTDLGTLTVAEFGLYQPLPPQ